jgi:dTDP-4-amino-4,6-dideoxygalactose transaminase
MHERSWKFDVKAQGWRYHMSNLMAAIGRAQLRKIDEFSLLRKNCALFYKQELLKIKEVTLFDFDYSEIMPHIFPIKVPSSKRDELMSELKSNNIECGIHYFPNHHLTLYSKTYKLNNVDTLYQQLISLPLHCEISQDDQERIVSVINKFFKK